MPDCNLVPFGSAEKEIFRNSFCSSDMLHVSQLLLYWSKNSRRQNSVLSDVCNCLKISVRGFFTVSETRKLSFESVLYSFLQDHSKFFMSFFFSPNYWLLFNNLVEDKTNYSLSPCSGKKDVFICTEKHHAI